MIVKPLVFILTAGMVTNCLEQFAVCDTNFDSKKLTLIVGPDPFWLHMNSYVSCNNVLKSDSDDLCSSNVFFKLFENLHKTVSVTKYRGLEKYVFYLCQSADKTDEFYSKWRVSVCDDGVWVPPVSCD